MNFHTNEPYGTGDASFQAAGGEAGIRQLVDEFFDRMGADERFATIYAMHPEHKDISRDKLARFLCGWHLAIATAERDQWLTCMTETVELQPFAADFKKYLMEQLFVPAEAVRRRCADTQDIIE
jgi:hemoglobin